MRVKGDAEGEKEAGEERKRSERKWISGGGGEDGEERGRKEGIRKTKRVRRRGWGKGKGRNR